MGQWDINNVLKVLEETSTNQHFQALATKAIERGSMSLEAYSKHIVSKSFFWAELQANTCGVLQRTERTLSESEKFDGTFNDSGKKNIEPRDRASQRSKKKDVLENVVQGIASSAMIKAFYGDY